MQFHIEIIFKVPNVIKEQYHTIECLKNIKYLNFKQQLLLDKFLVYISLDINVLEKPVAKCKLT